MSRALAPALALAMAILALLLATPYGGIQAQDQVKVKIRWVKYINPTAEYDLAFGTCIFGDYVAVVGEAMGAPGKPYVVLLRKSDGGVVKEWIGNEKGAFRNCISIGGKLYAVGATSVDGKPYGVIYVFDENLKILAKIKSESPSEYYSLAYDGKALYLGGKAYEDVDGDDWEEDVGLVEKRVLGTSTLPVKNSKKIYFSSWDFGWINDIGVEPSTGRIWAVGGYQDSKYKHPSLIIVFDDDLRELKVIDYTDLSEGWLSELYGIAFDGRQYVYVTGSLGVAKFSVDGELIAINRDTIPRYKIVYGYNYLYTFGGETISYAKRHMLYIHDTDLYIVNGYVLSENVNAGSFFKIGRPALEGNNIYVAGYDYAQFNSRIVVYSLSIEGVTVTTVTGTEGVTATTTTPTRETTSLLLVLIVVPIIIAATIAVILLLRRK